MYLDLCSLFTKFLLGNFKLPNIFYDYPTLFEVVVVVIVVMQLSDCQKSYFAFTVNEHWCDEFGHDVSVCYPQCILFP